MSKKNSITGVSDNTLANTAHLSNNTFNLINANKNNIGNMHFKDKSITELTTNVKSNAILNKTQKVKFDDFFHI
jgi:hypothetical protein